MIKKNKTFSHFIFILLFISFGFQTQAIEVEFEESKSVPLIFLTIALKGGSVTDPKGKDGLTYLMGQSLLRGTLYKNKDQVDTLLDQMGASLDVSIRSEVLEISGSVLSKERDRYLDLVKEILTKPAFSEEEFLKLKREALSDIAQSKSDDSSLLRSYWPRIFFGSHVYGTIRGGLEKTLKNITREDVIAHYKKIFQTNRLIIMGTGDSQPQNIVSWGRSLQLNPNTEELPKYSAPEIPKEKRVVIIDKPNRTQATIMLSHKGSPIQSEDYYPFAIMNHAFGGSSFQARLMQEMRVKTGWSYGATSGFTYALFPYAWSIRYSPAKQFLKDSLAKSVSLLAKLQENGLTQEEFDFAKKSLILSAGFMYDTPLKRLSNALNEKLLGLPKGFYERFASKINEVTLADVNLATHKFFNPSQFTVVVVATASDAKEAIGKALSIPVNQINVYPYDKIEDFLP